MAERSVHEAAVEAMAEAIDDAMLDNTGRSVGIVACHHVARAALAALASAEVREGLVAALYAQEGRWYEPEAAHDTNGKPIAGLRLWPIADLVLAALAGTDQSSTKGTP